MDLIYRCINAFDVQLFEIFRTWKLFQEGELQRTLKGLLKDNETVV